jgi:hypothetical protein
MNSQTWAVALVACALVLIGCQNTTGDDAAPKPTGQGQWQPKKAPIMTRWAKDVSPDNALPEYPRPQMVRKEWQNLNGLWDYAITAKDATTPPRQFEGRILVPFPIESALSGVMKQVGKDNRLWYRRTFTIPQNWNGQRVLLNFGAVDWDTTVYVNDKEIGKHTGGYDPFSFDITAALKPGGDNILVLSVWDPTTDGYQPMGKQHARPHGIWYTPTTGIWQTVWLEPVSKVAYVYRLQITPDVDAGAVNVNVNNPQKADNYRVRVTVRDGNDVVTSKEGTPGAAISLPIANARLWAPDSPHLYNLSIELFRDAKLAGDADIFDVINSYFGMRKISLAKDDKGINRLTLNNKPLFQHGPLDQGFWPDGLYTAPTDEALRYDIEMTKKFGFNMARKHVKVEPDRWYYWCDKLGLLVWQDMPSGDKHVAPGRGEITRTKESAENFERELVELIEDHYNHPCIVMWVPFNEGWGQYDTVRITNFVKQHDPTRLANPASGWNDYPIGDVHDMHNYPGPGMPPVEESRAAVLGEYGGLGLPLEGHTWQQKDNWGYRNFKDRESLTDAYLAINSRIHPLIGKGLCAAVYTQTTDVEVEVNGLMTYDRAINKIDPEVLAQAHAKLHGPPPTIKTIVPTAQSQPIEWSYTTERPDDKWIAPDFDASSWKKASAGFGTQGTPGTTARTTWNTPDIWIRRAIDLPNTSFSDPHLLIHHDEDAEVYINGQLAARTTGYSTEYTMVPLTAQGRAAVRPGKNTIAIHCKQTTGGQYIDAGIIDVVPPTR